MRFEFLALIVVFAVSAAEGANTITCDGTKPNPAGLITNSKILKCVAYVGKANKLCRCAVEALCGKNPKNAAACVPGLKSIIPDKYHKSMETYSAKCDAALKKFKPENEDKDSKTCPPVQACVEKYYNEKLCK